MRALLGPPTVVTRTRTGPADAAAGTVTVSWLSETTVGVTLLDPNVTLLAVARAVPVRVMELPPARGPEVLLREFSVGAPT